ncbi:MAG: hypothetical protein HRU09_18480 [Oligoflexales bacterium]|nr:hypothetical protein [Oligoflexales bacterium]
MVKPIARFLSVSMLLCSASSYGVSVNKVGILAYILGSSLPAASFAPPIKFGSTKKDVLLLSKDMESHPETSHTDDFSLISEMQRMGDHFETIIHDTEDFHEKASIVGAVPGLLVNIAALTTHVLTLGTSGITNMASTGKINTWALEEELRKFNEGTAVEALLALPTKVLNELTYLLMNGSMEIFNGGQIASQKITELIANLRIRCELGKMEKDFQTSVIKANEYMESNYSHRLAFRYFSLDNEKAARALHILFPYFSQDQALEMIQSIFNEDIYSGEFLQIFAPLLGINIMSRLPTEVKESDMMMLKAQHDLQIFALTLFKDCMEEITDEVKS